VPERQTDNVRLQEYLARLDRMLDLLDEQKRSVFILYEIEQMTMTEVATLVGCPLQTAYSRLHAARGRIQGALTDDERREARP
jgi:RNA polymerase sigma-70 factor (ECF subfamily)